jgi:hypothetical protein
MSDTDRQNAHSFHSSYLPQMSLLLGLPENCGGRVRSYPQPIYSSPCFSMLTYHPGGEQVCWCPQFWDTVSPHHNQRIKKPCSAWRWTMQFQPGVGKWQLRSTSSLNPLHFHGIFAIAIVKCWWMLKLGMWTGSIRLRMQTSDRLLCTRNGSGNVWTTWTTSNFLKGCAAQSLL